MSPGEPAGSSQRVGRRLMNGRIDLEFAQDLEGRTYLHRQYAGYPFHVCRAQYHDPEAPGLATLYLQSCSGGLYENDSLHLRISAGEGAEAHVSTQSATVVHSMPMGQARHNALVEGESGSLLEYLPDPQILFPHSRCFSTIEVRLTGSAIVLVSDSFLAHCPPGLTGNFAHYTSRIVIADGAGKPLAIDRLEIDGESFEERRPGTAGRFLAQATFVIACRGPLPAPLLNELLKVRPDGGDAVIGTSVLPSSAGLLVRILAADGAALKGTLHRAWCAARLALKGALPAERRK